MEEAVAKNQKIMVYGDYDVDGYWDLVRTGMAETVLAAGTHEWRTEGWHSGKKYWPLPQAEVDKDPNLVQNVGY